ncbi:hypothetical protein [Streptomyces fractus]|uniref:hypothetical protein n=1 Tax=Streptomyces fractus TaxID=641806 RepID=UPI003CEA3254
MKAFHRMSGDVRIDLPNGEGLRIEVRDTPRSAFAMPLRQLIVPRKEFEELAQQIRDEDEEKVRLRRECDETQGAFLRACDELDEWKRKAAERPDVDELKAVIVSQAREIARRKGESG